MVALLTPALIGVSLIFKTGGIRAGVKGAGVKKGPAGKGPIRYVNYTSITLNCFKETTNNVLAYIYPCSTYVNLFQSKIPGGLMTDVNYLYELGMGSIKVAYFKLDLHYTKGQLTIAR